MHTALRVLPWGALALLSSQPHAQWSDDPAQNLAVAEDAAPEVQPKVVPTAAGGTWMSWYHSDPDGMPAFGFDVRVQRLDAGGRPQLADGGVLVADRGFSSTQDYGLAIDAEGDALLAFRDDRLSGTEITAAKVDAATGALVWGATGVQLTNTADFLASPAIAGTSDGGAVVAWAQGSDVHLRKLDAQGVPVWNDDVVLSPSSDNYAVSDLNASDAGGVIVSFVRFGGFSSPRHLFAQKLDADGDLQWGAGHVAVFDGGSLQIGTFPDFVPDGSGGAVFGWYGTAPLEAYAQRVLADGSEAFPHNGVSASTDASQLRFEPSVAFDPLVEETFLFYTELDSGQSQRGVSAQKYDALGARQWSDTGRTLVPLGSSDVLSVNGLALCGDSMAFWVSEPSFGQGRLFGATLDAAGSVTVGPFDVSSTPAGKSRVRAALATTGTAVLAWEDDRAGDDDLYAQNAFPDGGLGGLATVAVRNGSGANALCLANRTLPTLGTSWETEVDTTGHPGALGSSVAALAAPSSGTFLSAGELLVDVTSTLLASSTVATTGTDLHAIAIPNDVALVGLSGSAQAVIVGGGAELCNALDVHLGL